MSVHCSPRGRWSSHKLERGQLRTSQALCKWIMFHERRNMLESGVRSRYDGGLSARKHIMMTTRRDDRSTTVTSVAFDHGTSVEEFVLSRSPNNIGNICIQRQVIWAWCWAIPLRVACRLLVFEEGEPSLSAGASKGESRRVGKT